jgi:hypothetical protein
MEICCLSYSIKHKAFSLVSNPVPSCSRNLGPWSYFLPKLKLSRWDMYRDSWNRVRQHEGAELASKCVAGLYHEQSNRWTISKICGPNIFGHDFGFNDWLTCPWNSLRICLFIWAEPDAIVNDRSTGFTGCHPTGPLGTIILALPE